MVKWRKHKKLLAVPLLVVTCYLTWDYFTGDDFDFDEFYRKGILGVPSV